MDKQVATYVAANRAGLDKGWAIEFVGRKHQRRFPNTRRVFCRLRRGVARHRQQDDK